jgi:hypothetical protein
LENKLYSVRSELYAYREKNIDYDISHINRFGEKFKYRKYFFWFMLLFYVARIMIPILDMQYCNNMPISSKELIRKNKE